MSLDNIRVVDEPTMARPDKSLTANSIHFKVASLLTAEEKIRVLKEAKDEALNRARELVEDAVAVAEKKPVEAMNKEAEAERYAKTVAELEKEINVLEGAPKDAELVDTRAIKLMDKMYTEAKSKSDILYGTEIVAEEKPSEEINVEDIAKKNEEPLKDTISTSIGASNLSDGDIKDIFDEVFAAQESEDIKSDDIARIANEKLNESETKSTESSEEFEYKAMSDQEVAESQENIEKDKYDKEYAERAKNYEAQYAADIAKIDNTDPRELSFREDKPIRDEVIVAPEREEPAEEKIEEYTSIEDKVATVETPINVEEKVEPRSTPITIETKGKLESYRACSLEELEKIINENGKSAEELKEKANSAEANVEESRKQNAEIAHEQEDAEKRREELAEERSKVAQELKDMMIERAVALDEEKDNLQSAIQSKEEELENINKDTASRREQITSINTDSKSLEDEIEKYRQMKKMFVRPEESGDSKQVVR